MRVCEYRFSGEKNGGSSWSSVTLSFQCVSTEFQCNVNTTSGYGEKDSSLGRVLPPAAESVSRTNKVIITLKMRTGAYIVVCFVRNNTVLLKIMIYSLL